MEHKVSVSRVFNAPIERVWELWTKPELVKQWWGPDKFVCTMANIYFEEGATSLVNMAAPASFGGQTTYSIWTYTQIIYLESIELVQNLANERGVKQNPIDLGMPEDFPQDIRTVVTFKSMASDKTEMTVTEYANFGQMSHFAQLGLEQSIDKAVKVFLG